MTLLARGDCEGAIESLRADANQDPAGAGYYLALCLIQNDGSVLDVQSLLRRAAASGNVRAQYTLGLLDTRSGDQIAGRVAIAGAARKGHLMARRWLQPMASPPVVRKAGPTELLKRIRDHGDSMAAAGRLDLLEYAINADDEVAANRIMDQQSAASSALRKSLALAIIRRMEALSSRLISVLSPDDLVIAAHGFEVPLLLALRAESPKTVRLLLARGVPLDTDSARYVYDKNSPRMTSVLEDHSEPVEVVVRYLRSLVRSDSSSCLFSLATRSGQEAVLRGLIGQSASLWRTGCNGPLEIAYWTMAPGMLELLLELDPPLPARERLLMHAIRRDDAAMVSRVLDTGLGLDRIVAEAALRSAVHADEEVGKAMLAMMMGPGGHEELLFLRENDRGRTLFMDSLRYGNLGLASVLADGDSLTADALGRSPLWYVATFGGADLVAAFEDNGEAAHLADQRGHTPLIRATLRGRADMVAALLELGSDIDHRTSEGNTALMIAAAGNAELSGMLLRSGADHRLRNVHSATALMIAAAHDCAGCTRALLSAGANPGRKNARGQRARDLTTDPAIRRLLD